jgi:hypothetical protein
LCDVSFFTLYFSWSTVLTNQTAAAAARVVATTDALAGARAAVAVGPVTPAGDGGAHDREVQRAMQMRLEEHVLDQARQLS